MFKTKLIDKFHEALFCTNFNGFASATQNAKTDILSECEDFDEWFEMLITVFAKETRLSRTAIRTEVFSDPEFMDSMRAEYEELKELCDDEDEDFDDYEDEDEE